MDLWVKENGKSEGFNVMLKIEIYISLERGQTSIRSYVTREFEEFLKGGKQMYEQSCAPTNQIRRCAGKTLILSRRNTRLRNFRCVL